MNKIYLLTFDTNRTDFNYGTFHNNLTMLYPNVIKDWWHYLHSTYIVVSPLAVNDLYNQIIRGSGNLTFLLVEIIPKNSQGWLNPEAWKWINKYH